MEKLKEIVEANQNCMNVKGNDEIERKLKKAHKEV